MCTGLIEIGGGLEHRLARNGQLELEIHELDVELRHDDATSPGEGRLGLQVTGSFPAVYRDPSLVTCVGTSECTGAVGGFPITSEVRRGGLKQPDTNGRTRKSAAWRHRRRHRNPTPPPARARTSRIVGPPRFPPSPFQRYRFMMTSMSDRVILTIRVEWRSRKPVFRSVARSDAQLNPPKNGLPDSLFTIRGHVRNGPKSSLVLFSYCNSTIGARDVKASVCTAELSAYRAEIHQGF